MFFNDVAYAMGSSGGSGGPGGEALGMNLLLMVVIFAIFYFLIIRPQSKEARRIKDMLANLKRGDRVITVGGLYGEVVEIRGDIAVLNLGDSTVEIGMKYIANLAPSRSGAGASGGKQKRRPPRRNQEKALTEAEGEQRENEVIDAEAEEQADEPKDETAPAEAGEAAAGNPAAEADTAETAAEENAAGADEPKEEEKK